MTPQQIIAARAPCTPVNVRLTQLIALAEPLIGPAFGANRNLAIAYLVLHWIAQDETGSAPGPLTSESEGGLSRSYGWSGEYGELTSTRWGLALTGLRRSNILGARNRMTPV